MIGQKNSRPVARKWASIHSWPSQLCMAKSNNGVKYSP